MSQSFGDFGLTPQQEQALQSLGIRDVVALHLCLQSDVPAVRDSVVQRLALSADECAALKARMAIAGLPLPPPVAHRVPFGLLPPDRLGEK